MPWGWPYSGMSRVASDTVDKCCLCWPDSFLVNAYSCRGRLSGLLGLEGLEGLSELSEVSGLEGLEGLPVLPRAPGLAGVLMTLYKSNTFWICDTWLEQEQQQIGIVYCFFTENAGKKLKRQKEGNKKFVAQKG